MCMYCYQSLTTKQNPEMKYIEYTRLGHYLDYPVPFSVYLSLPDAQLLVTVTQSAAKSADALFPIPLDPGQGRTYHDKEIALFYLTL